MKKAQMSIGPAVQQIPIVRRKYKQKTRLEQVVSAAKKQPGAILPIYTGSVYAAANLATSVRKAHRDWTVAVRKHIVYVQAVPAPASDTRTSEPPVINPTPEERFLHDVFNSR